MQVDADGHGTRRWGFQMPTFTVFYWLAIEITEEVHGPYECFKAVRFVATALTLLT